MYTTKVFNPKVAESYLNIGDPYVKTSVADGRTRGKQFLTNPSKVGQLQGYFSPFSYHTDSYQDSNKYIVTQPRDARKLGFGTHDANRRDEFTLDIRAKQYKEAIDLEKSWEKDAIARRRASTAPGLLQSGALPRIQADARHFQCAIPELQYEIGRTRQGCTPTCNKCKHDTFYCIHRLSLMSGDSLRRADGRSHYSGEFTAERFGQLPPQPIVRKNKDGHLSDLQDKNPFHTRKML